MRGGTLRSILVASDLGPGSDPVVRAAARLAAALQADLHLVHAREPERFRRQERTREEAEAALRAQVRDAGDVKDPAGLRVADGAAHEVIEAAAAGAAADLIVLGPQTGGEVRAHFLGTTADRVIRTAEVPCLVLRGPLAEPVRSIGVPTDLSGPARGALDLAFWLARRLSIPDAAEVRVFHVGWFVDRVDDPGLETEKYGPALEREVAAAVERAGGEAPARIHREVLWGVSPAEAIRDYAGRTGLDLLVMGTHGHGGLRRFLIGSVASGVAREAPCPVLLVPPDPS